MWYKLLFEEMYKNQDTEKAEKMSAYMRNQFDFLGIATPLRKNIIKSHFKDLKEENFINWDFVNSCWNQDFREFQYVAVSYLNLKQEYLKEADIDKLKELIVKKSWWDTIDGLDKIVGNLAFKYKKLNDLLLKWSLDDNFWLRRIAIDHQLNRKENTNTELLEKIIVNNLNKTEFFINKAIGWSLREYSKTNPNWVCNFVNKHKTNMSNLSIREASKYL